MSYAPMIDGFDLELLGGIDTGIEKAIAEYDIPFAVGGILDDMGVKARRFQLKTIWRRKNYEAHRYFIEHCQLDQVNRFVHPELGAVNGRVKSLNVVHDARRSCAEISVEFIEDVSPEAVPAYNPPLVASLEEGLAKAAAALIGSLGAELGAGGLDTAAEIDADKPLAGQIPAKKLSASALLARMDQGISTLRGAFNKVLNPVDSAVGMINYGLSLPGTIIGSVAGAIERAALIAEGVGNAPNMFVSSLRSNVARLVASVPALGNQLKVAAASIGALFTGKMFAKDESQKALLRRVEDANPWLPNGTSLNMPSVPQVLTANELDESLARIREVLQDGIDAARAMGCADAVPILASQADELARYINTVKLERDKIITVDVEDAMPLHLICLRHGLPYGYADRICTINNFSNPNFVVGQARLYERRG